MLQAPGYHFLQQLAIMYGSTPIIRWIRRISTLLEGKEEEILSNSITVRSLLLSFGELAIEAGMLNAALSRTGGDSEIQEKELFCHFSLTIQLIAFGNDRRNISCGKRELCIDDLAMIIEDEWLKAVPVVGLRF